MAPTGSSPTQCREIVEVQHEGAPYKEPLGEGDTLIMKKVPIPDIRGEWE